MVGAGVYEAPLLTPPIKNSRGAKVVNKGVLKPEKLVTRNELRQSILKREKTPTADDLKRLGFHGDKFKKVDKVNVATGRIDLNTEVKGGKEEATKILDKLQKEFAPRGLINPAPPQVKADGSLRIFYQYKDGSYLQLRTKGKSGHVKIDITDMFKNNEEKITFKSGT